MAGRREKLDRSDPFARRRPPSLEELTNAMLTPSTPVSAAQTVDIFEIHPDPTQPRRSVPSTVREHWDGRPETITTMFGAWINAYARECEVGFDVAQTRILKILAGEDTARAQDDSKDPGSIGQSLLKVVDLAASIHAEGLVNPVTLTRMEDGYRIETGERRWLAYHLLYSVSGEDWRQIPASVGDEVNVWKQAYENNARDNLNAIGKARQFATLLMDLLERHQGLEFAPFHAFDDDQHYYAQVADSERFGIPRGYGEVIITAMGVTNRSVTTRFRNLLKLPALTWTAADDLNWSERKLRMLTSIPEDRAVRLTARWAAEENYVLPVGNIPDEPPKPDDTPADILNHVLNKSRRDIERKLRKVDRMQALDMIETYERWLQDLKRKLQ
jgi:hypothetical protein